MIEIRLAPELLDKLRKTESHYDEQAYLFVLEGIEYLQNRLAIRRHVSGPELARACRDFALDQYGLMARQVLGFWGIRRTDDIGRIVYALVEVGLLVTQPGDRPEDFRSVYDFDEAFSATYLWNGVPRAADGSHLSRGETLESRE